ncbi:hypothetical protein BGX38DRAFT_1276801 [Terfezia claveryi]|nr:hypothetical protein BGX38DRAFT_1276801 [Terfezia claveryi]
MTSNCPVKELLKTKLTDFLKLYGFLTYDDGTPGTRWWILMNSRLTEEMFHTVIMLIVEEWMEMGITQMSEFESTQVMNLDEVISMVEEQVTDYLAELGV